MKTPDPHNQKDLFVDSPKDHGRSPVESARSFIRLKSNPHFAVSLEQIFITLIVVLILFVLVFMMGVLRGRSLRQPADATRPAPTAVHSQAATQPQVLIGQNTVLASRTAAISTAPKFPEPTLANTAKKPYTIQLVTYRNEDRALKEIAVLKARGLDARLIRRSGYFEICVGQYADRKEAQKDLRNLGNRYKGCYLRKL